MKREFKLAQMVQVIQKDWQIGFKLDIFQSSATRIRQGLVENVARWEQWYKNVH